MKDFVSGVGGSGVGVLPSAKGLMVGIVEKLELMGKRSKHRIMTQE